MGKLLPRMLQRELDVMPRDKRLLALNPWSLYLLCRLEERALSRTDAMKYFEEYREEFLDHGPSEVLRIYSSLQLIRIRWDYLELTDKGKMFLDIFFLKPEELRKKYLR
jgi:hypothetical protein